MAKTWLRQGSLPPIYANQAKLTTDGQRSKRNCCKELKRRSRLTNNRSGAQIRSNLTSLSDRTSSWRLSDGGSSLIASCYQYRCRVVAQTCAVHKFSDIGEQDLQANIRGLHLGEKPLRTILFAGPKSSFGDAVGIKGETRLRAECDFGLGEFAGGDSERQSFLSRDPTMAVGLDEKRRQMSSAGQSQFAGCRIELRIHHGDKSAAGKIFDHHVVEASQHLTRSGTSLRERAQHAARGRHQQ